MNHDVDIKPEISKLLENNIMETLEAISTGKDFLNRTPKLWEKRSRINEGDYIKL